MKKIYPIKKINIFTVPRYPRLCNSVAWSHVETNMLGVALEKHRSDHCILVWDVNRGMGPSEESLRKENILSVHPDVLFDYEWSYHAIFCSRNGHISTIRTGSFSAHCWDGAVRNMSQCCMDKFIQSNPPCFHEYEIHQDFWSQR